MQDESTGSSCHSLLIATPTIFSRFPMNPFDLKALVLSQSAQHPVVVHFPIALFMISYLFDLLTLWHRSPALAAAARYNLIVAALATPFALLTGLLAWQWKHEGVALKGNLRLHLIAALSSATLIWTLCWLRHRRAGPSDDEDRFPSMAYLGLGFFAVAVVALTGHLGGAVAG